MKKILSVFVLIITALILTGCWSKKELNEIAIITGMGIDKQGDEYLLSVQIVVPQEAGPNAKGRSTVAAVATQNGPNICDAFRRLTYKTTRFLNLSHVSIVTISETVARDGMVESLDCLVRDDQLRPTIMLFIAKDGLAKDILTFNPMMESMSSASIRKMITNSETNYSGVHSVTMKDVANVLSSDGTQLYLPGIKYEGDVEKGKKAENIQQVEMESDIIMEPYAVFKSDKLVGWLDEYTSKGVNLILDKVKGTMISVPCEDEKFFALDVGKVKTKVKVEIKNKKPLYKIQTDIEGMLCQVDCDIDLTDTKNIEKMEKEFAEAIKAQIDHAINTLQTEHQVDILGFGNALHRKDPKLWKKMSKEWDTEFQTVEYEIKVKVTINRTGVTINPLIKDLK
jgi:spore germination protein KC